MPHGAQRSIIAAVLVGAGLLLAGCSRSMEVRGTDGFIRLDSTGFKLNGKPFFPLAVNYIMGYRSDGQQLWCSASADYQPQRADHFCSKDSTLLHFRADMELIKEMGFNTVRFVGIDHDQGRDEKGHGDSLGVKANVRMDYDTIMLFSDPRTHEPYFHALDEMLGIVEQVGLKAILLTWVIPDKPATAAFQAKLLDHLHTNTTILAFDLFNEPLYFDRPERPKHEAERIAKEWHALMRAHAPDHLLTIGYTGIREVFEFDPNIVDIDFVSFHPYEYEPDQVVNEIYWYSTYVKIPWIIGETAIPADNDSVPHEKQLAFARRTLERAFDCKAAGYSWWQYKDVAWNYFHADYMGVVTREGHTRTRSGLDVPGTVKPVAQAIKEFDPTQARGPCTCEANYYNYSDGHLAKLTGRLVDADGKPIVGGVVLGWSRWWDRSYHTVTHEDGRFELRGDLYFHHWMVSAVGRTMERGECAPNEGRRGPDGIAAIDLGTITLPWLKDAPDLPRAMPADHE
ncbi:MAG TPA: cellulase family glycosylhydrolase [Flavobacteriales bacterium]|jgi:hypothetical protein|nr:cellulase family glycosylhydrolase [Flavobacteriales bacterium]